MSFKGLYRDADYGLVHKDFALFGTLSLKARGLYALLSCWPLSERLSVSAVLLLVPDGREAVTNAWRELVSAGLISAKHRKGTKVVAETAKCKVPKRPEQHQGTALNVAETSKYLNATSIRESILKEESSLKEEILQENTTNDRATQFRKSSIGTLEAFMALKVARDAGAAGIDVEHYFTSILEWSNKKNRQLRTAHGWLDTVTGAIRRDKVAGKLKMKGQAEAQQDDQLRFLQLGR
jgi:hypothetical protein